MPGRPDTDRGEDGPLGLPEGVVGGVRRAVEERPQLRGRRPARALVVPRPDSRVERLLLSLGQHGEGTVRRRVVVADALDVHGDGPRQRVERPPELRFRTPERDAEPSVAEDPRSLADEGVLLERPADSVNGGPGSTCADSVWQCSWARS